MFANYHFRKFSKRFSEITVLRLVISRHSVKFYEIHTRAVQDAQIPRGKVVLQRCLHFCLGSWNIQLYLSLAIKTRVVIIVFVYNYGYKLKCD